MAEDDHQQFIHEVIELAREQVLDFTVLTINEQGHTTRIDIATEFFRSEANKERLKLAAGIWREGHRALCARRRMLDGNHEADILGAGAQREYRALSGPLDR
jgi:hypothetical protein